MTRSLVECLMISAAVMGLDGSSSIYKNGGNWGWVLYNGWERALVEDVSVAQGLTWSMNEPVAVGYQKNSPAHHVRR